MTPVIKPIILASQSAGRRELLAKAGLTFTAVAAHIDEEAIRDGLAARRAKARDIADALAEAKALKISRKNPGALVIGSDQLLIAPDGDIFSKAASKEEAEIQIARLAGRVHKLVSAVVVCEGGKAVWRIVDQARLTMRAMTAEEIIGYVASHWDKIRHCAGCYRIEAEGAALFEKIEGAKNTIVGMPMEPLLEYLTLRGYERAA